MLPPVLTLPIHRLEVATAVLVATTVQGLIPIAITNAITTSATTVITAITAITIVTNIETATSIETSIESNKKSSPSLAS